MAFIEVRNLKKAYENNKIKALNDIDLTIEKGESISIIGPSGSGKSTLLNLLGGLDVADSGTIKVGDYDLTNAKNLNKYRSEVVGFVFQLHNLIFNLSVVENVEIPMYELKISNKQRREKALKLLDLVNLKNKADSKPNVLSGGERQRVAIARSLANSPSLILADEPTGSLDSKNSANIIDLLLKLQKEENITLIIVTHDLSLTKFTNRTIEVLDGKIINK
jgi:putative ABC transport system ATP-binding protein